MSKTKIYGPVRFFLLLVAILLAVTAFVHISTVNAGSTLVTTSDNSGTGSLREAITNASAGDVITFDASLAGVTITLSSELPDVRRQL
jgi:hypothetical protein